MDDDLEPGPFDTELRDRRHALHGANHAAPSDALTSVEARIRRITRRRRSALIVSSLTIVGVAAFGAVAVAGNDDDAVRVGAAATTVPDTTGPASTGPAATSARPSPTSKPTSPRPSDLPPTTPAGTTARSSQATTSTCTTAPTRSRRSSASSSTTGCTAEVDGPDAGVLWELATASGIRTGMPFNEIPADVPRTEIGPNHVAIAEPGGEVIVYHLPLSVLGLSTSDVDRVLALRTPSPCPDPNPFQGE